MAAGGSDPAATIAQQCGLDNLDAHAALWVVQGRAPLLDAELAPYVSQIAALYASRVLSDAQARGQRQRRLRALARNTAHLLLLWTGIGLLVPDGLGFAPGFLASWVGALIATGFGWPQAVENHDSRLRRAQHYDRLQETCLQLVIGQPVHS
jgi:hypothetical protein